MAPSTADERSPAPGLRPDDPASTGPGHAAGDPRAPSPARAAVAAAMVRLLAAGGARTRSAYTAVRGAVVHHLEAGPSPDAGAAPRPARNAAATPAGPPVLLLHGAGGGAANWYRIIGPLSARRPVLAPDLPGFGLSDRIPVESPPGRAGAAFVCAWLDAVGAGRVDVVGTSFGGLVALRLAQLAPERVRRLVLLDTVGLGRELPWPVRLAALPGIGRLLLAPSRAGTRALLRHLLVADSSRIRDHEGVLVDYLWRSARAGSSAWMAAALRAFAGVGGQEEVIGPEELARIGHPTLVAWGEDDAFVPPRHGERAAALLPNGRFALIQGAGHSPNWEAPAVFLALLEPFLGAPGDASPHP